MIAKAEFEARAPFKMIETRLWIDEKFVKLSRIPPCGQGLWVYLLTGPHTLQTHMMPGVYLVSRAALAEGLQWSIEEFDGMFSQISGRKMAVADWDNHVLWLPNALKRHMPRSPHNVLAWRAGWALIPDCALKRRIYRATKPLIFGRGPAFQEAFDAAVRPVPHGSSDSSVFVKERGPSSRLRSDHKSKDGPTINTNMVPEPLTEVKSEPDRIRAHARKGFKTYEESKTLNPTNNVKGVNGATAPLPPRAYTRVSDMPHDGPHGAAEAASDKAHSEFASVLRWQHGQVQANFFDDEIAEAAPDKALREHGPTMSENMVPRKAARKSRKASSDKAHGPDTGPTWEAYSEAYFGRYGVAPVRNASVNAQMLHFVERIGAAEAPDVARFYVDSCSASYYVKRCHAVGVLLTDAESLHTQWATHRPVTATEAAMADRTATNANAFGPLITEARERERRESEHGD